MTVTDLDEIKTSAFDQDKLTKLALADAVTAFARFAINGRSPRDAITMLERWGSIFERNERKPQ